MKMFWDRRKPVDERIVNTENKIYKEVYILTIGICILSIALKYYFYGITISSVVTELSIIIIPSIFFTIRMVWLGLYSDEVELHDRNSKTSMNVKSVVIALAFGIFMALYFGIRSAILYAHTDLQRVLYFISVFIVSFMMYIPLFLVIVVLPMLIANKASKKVNSKNQD